MVIPPDDLAITAPRSVLSTRASMSTCSSRSLTSTRSSSGLTSTRSRSAFTFTRSRSAFTFTRSRSASTFTRSRSASTFTRSRSASTSTRSSRASTSTFFRIASTSTRPSTAFRSMRVASSLTSSALSRRSTTRSVTSWASASAGSVTRLPAARSLSRGFTQSVFPGTESGESLAADELPAGSGERREEKTSGGVMVSASPSVGRRWQLRRYDASLAADEMPRPTAPGEKGRADPSFLSGESNAWRCGNGSTASCPSASNWSG